MYVARAIDSRWLMVVASVVLVLATLLSVSMGPMQITMLDSLKALLPFSSDELSVHVVMIVQQVRLPRTLLAIAVGGILAVCGTVMQGLFRNPLADPGIIGVSAGAALGAALAIVLFADWATQFPVLLQLGSVPLFAFLGGALVTLLVYRLGSSATGTSVTMMLLAGVAVSALAGAALGLLNYFADDQALRNLSLWTMGSLAGASTATVALAFISLALLLVLFIRDAQRLNALLLGEAEARHMGVKVQSLKRRLIILTAAGVGISVAVAGMIGFIGLIVPHLGRMLIGPNHKPLLPLAALLGALLLLLADMIARTAIAPLDMPVGIITAILGAPFFIGLLIKQRGRL